MKYLLLLLLLLALSCKTKNDESNDFDDSKCDYYLYGFEEEHSLFESRFSSDKCDVSVIHSPSGIKYEEDSFLCFISEDPVNYPSYKFRIGKKVDKTFCTFGDKCSESYCTESKYTKDVDWFYYTILED
jgi:hypothetical protein